MATTGAVFTPAGPFAPRAFIDGLGGDGTLSKAQPATVHQGLRQSYPSCWKRCHDPKTLAISTLSPVHIGCDESLRTKQLRHSTASCTPPSLTSVKP